MTPTLSVDSTPEPAGPGYSPLPDVEHADVADRHALRRVVGISTELADISEVEYRKLRLEHVVLVGVWTTGTAADAQRSLVELAALSETAGAQVLDGLVQRRDKPDPATYIGSGKAAELKEVVLACGADTVICDGELSPGQLTQLEDVVKVKVVDRVALILDIFAQHARSRAGKAQVELAQLRYLLPRLRGWGAALSRTGGGIGTRQGSGETKLETDRRRIRARMSALRKDIAAMAAVRTTQRQSRRRSQTPSVAIAGYTNAGKSSLLNRLTDADVLVQDALFATLDPIVRRTQTPDGRSYTLTDTVGFVRHLPHQLVDAFASTLEEVAAADVIMHVVDAHDPDPLGQLRTVRAVLADVGAGDIPELVVVNKVDAADAPFLAQLRGALPDAMYVSAVSGEGVDQLREAVAIALPRPQTEVDVCVPFERGDVMARVYRDGEVLAVRHEPDGTKLRALVSPELAAALHEL
ncbi:MAG: GTPase HflX [Acidimicrobiales bacterium]|nr:MAG: GTPase HflX [Acidimicrobiales bacterium]